ncbi:hypothetical protein VTJ04DRAFT_9293 [Mycothermus thermophilus]|uniref:uncharacterized protein n=1 Tax=Humicola insolens TaxID=85995 RepID=UPI00374393D9
MAGTRTRPTAGKRYREAMESGDEAGRRSAALGVKKPTTKQSAAKKTTRKQPDTKVAFRGSASTRKAIDKSAPKKPHTRRSRTARQQQQAAQGDDEAVDEAASEAADEAVDGSVVVDSAAEESGDENVGAPVIDITSSPAAPPKKQDDAPPPTISVKISIDVRWFPNDHYRSIRTILPKPTDIVSTETVKTSPDVDMFDTDSPDLTCGLSKTIRSLQFDLVEDVGRSVALAGVGVAAFLMTEYKAQAYYHQRYIDTLKSGKLPAPRGRETTILPFLLREQIMELFRGKRAPRYNIVIIHKASANYSIYYNKTNCNPWHRGHDGNR